MAEMEKLVSTQLYSKPFWNNNDPSKNKQLTISLLNNSTQVAITQAGPDGKFKDGKRLAVTMPYFNHTAFLNMCRDMQKRLIKIIEKNEKQEKEALIIWSGKNMKESNQRLEVNIYSTESSEFKAKFGGYIKLYKKDADGKEDSAIIWLPTSRTIYRGSKSDDKPAKDFDAFQLFQELELLMEAIIARTSLSRDEHLKKYLRNLYGDNDNNNNKEYKGKSSDSDDDSFPY